MFAALSKDIWNEMLFPDGSPTGVVLGQLPDERHVEELVRTHNVGAVVSCVERFELDKFDVDFQQLGVKQKACVLLALL